MSITYTQPLAPRIDVLSGELDASYIYSIPQTCARVNTVFSEQSELLGYRPRSRLGFASITYAHITTFKKPPANNATNTINAAALSIWRKPNSRSSTTKVAMHGK